MGQGPVGDAVAHAAGQGAAGPWRSSTLAGSNEEVEGARSTLQDERFLALVSSSEQRKQGKHGGDGAGGLRWGGAAI